MTTVTFKISSALKNIIGKELITNDFIAVYELVKNAFDANAREVEIIFESLKTESPRIIIKDNGEGMDEEDLRNKWLFVAYSARKLEQDYRDKIKSNRIYAGAKGIGRFSCDRLGVKLKLTTRKKRAEDWNVLDVDWSDFEKDATVEFRTIKAQLTQTKDVSIPKLQHGTVLEISELRNNDWDREKLLKLRQSLERLINPHQENDVERFMVVLTAPDELEDDKLLQEQKPEEPWNIVNGSIRNFLFEALELKTTQIQLEIDRDGELLMTTLIDRGTLVYELMEHNPYKGVLFDVQISLFHLNRSAKMAFTRRMGLPPVKYGSVFLYKNGFRVHPFGDVGDDSLEIDRRKQQGLFRFLGTRDLSGRIEINGRNPEFQETSSRDGGLIKNKAFEALKELFFEYALRRLENFVINLARFGSQGEYPELIDPNSAEQRQLTFDLIVKLTQSSDVVDIHYNRDVLNILENKSAESVTSLLKNLERIAATQDNNDLDKEIRRAKRQVTLLAKAKEEAEAETEKERNRADKAEEKARESDEKAQEAQHAARKAQDEATGATTQNLFLKSILSKDLQNVIGLHHSISVDAMTIENFASESLKMVKDESKPLKREAIRANVEKIIQVARKILTISRFATHANFRADAEKVTADITAYIREYLLNVYAGIVLNEYNQKIKIEFKPETGKEFLTQFTPIKVSIILDNLVNNSIKHEAKSITVSVAEVNNDKVIISFQDDGTGISKKILPSLFQIGATTTKGSGLGLYHSRLLMHEMNGEISVNENSVTGAEFILTFNKKA
ncbi:MAG: histidine kinase [Chloroflexota bacterium]|nr:MAG: histidine kinase [Chloroflexota bacterium]